MTHYRIFKIDIPDLENKILQGQQKNRTMTQ